MSAIATEETWPSAALRTVLLSLESGSRPKGGVRSIHDGVASVGGEHLTSNGGFNFETTRYVPDSFYKSMRRGHIRPGDVLVVKDGATTGKVSLVRDDFPFRRAVVNEHVFVCRPGPSISPEYLFWYLFSNSGQQAILEHFRGSAQGGITQDFADGTLIPVPPLPVQDLICKHLDDIFGRTAIIRSSLTSANRAIERFRRSILAAACSGHLTANWREANPRAMNDQPTDAVQETAHRHSSRRLWGAGVIPDLTEEERSALPSTWRWLKVSDLASPAEEAVQIGPMSMKSSEFALTGVPVLNVGCVQPGFIDSSKADHLPPQRARDFSPRYEIKAGDVLFTRSGTVGRCAVASETHNGSLITFHLLRVRPDRHVCLPDYLWVVFQGAPSISRQTLEGQIGSSRAGFNTRLLESLDVPVPPLLEQAAIVHLVDKLLSTCAAVERNTLGASTRLEAATSATLSAVLSNRSGLEA
ncbi:MAG TPA: restriction endonuclease subunit S [Nitrospira sp.]|nr:restriction endonuclease subunit S [Nitrospira sp.]